MMPAKNAPRPSSGVSSPLVSVYSGRVCIGFVLNRGSSAWEAFTAEQKSLGVFATQQDAIAAVMQRRSA
jgi:hypothetical protein